MRVDLDEAESLILAGELVAVPTETVYGLAADALNDDALDRLYRAKGRPSDHPVILHVADLAMARPYMSKVSLAIEALTEAFWPGPLTLLVERSAKVSDRITGGRLTVGVRSPKAPLAQELLRRLGRPFVAPSANRFGHVSPTTAAHVEEEFFGRVAVLDGGACSVGIESTIVAVRDDALEILRPGALGGDALGAVVNLPIRALGGDDLGVPGTLASHYAPRQKLTLVSGENLDAPDLKGVVVLSFGEKAWANEAQVIVLPTDPEGYARELYRAIRLAEAKEPREIWVETVPFGDRWDAVRDRLGRAATK